MSVPVMKMISGLRWGCRFLTDVYNNHSAGKHDRGPFFYTLFSFRLIRSRSTGSI